MQAGLFQSTWKLSTVTSVNCALEGLLLYILHDLGLLGVFCLAHRAGLEVEWSAVEKPLRKAVKKYVQNDSSDGDGDEDMGEAQVAEDEPVDRHVTVTWC